MTSINRCFSLMPFLFVFLTGVALASAETPEEVVKRFCDTLRKTGDPKIMIDYVDWDSAFDRLSGREKIAYQVTNSSEYRKYVEEIYTNPKEAIGKRLQAIILSMPEGARPKSEDFQTAVFDGIAGQQEELRRDLKQTIFEIGKTVMVNEGRSCVPVTVRFNGQNSSQAARLIKKGDSWLLTSIEFMEEGLPGKGGEGAPEPREDKCP